MVRTALALAVLVTGLTACGGDDSDNDSGPASASETVAITATDFAFKPESVTLDGAGTYSFEVVNKGQVVHALEIEGDGTEGETETVEPGGRASVTVELKDGTYELHCPVGNHADQGMTGELTVGDEMSESGRDGY